MVRRVKVALYGRALVYRGRNVGRVGSLTVCGGLEGLLKNWVPGLTKGAVG
jgi:hypothetical protein